MGKWISLSLGMLAIFVGIWLLIAWISDFLMVFRGTVPAMFIFGGLIAVFLGISEIKDEIAAKKEEKKEEKKE